MNIWLVQYLCPSRHAICAAPYNHDEQPQDDIEQKLREELTTRGIDAHCALCGSRDLQFEHRKLPYTDWDMALRALHILEMNNILTRLEFDRMRTPRN